MNETIKKQDPPRSIRFPKELESKILESAQKETRTFSSQVIHIVKKYYELQEKK